MCFIWSFLAGISFGMYHNGYHTAYLFIGIFFSVLTIFDAFYGD